MELNKINLKKFIKSKDLDFKEMEDIEISIYRIEEKFGLDWNVGVRSTNDGSDYWLECSYYSQKICKTIVFDTDFQDSFKNIDDFIEAILQYNFDIKNFENNLKYN